MINSYFQFLGASLDGMLCDNGLTEIVEIKCPFTARNMNLVDACEDIKDFFTE